MSLQEQLTVAVIGVGHWGPNVVRNFVNHPRVHLRYVCDIDREAFGRVSNLIGKGCQFVTDPSKIFSDEDIDAVAVVTPAVTHYNLTKQALLAKKHVLCEKPLTLDVGEGEELCRLAEVSGRKLMIAFTFLFNNGVRRLKELNSSDCLGKVYYLTSKRTHIGLVRQDVDVVWDLAPHDICIFNFILDSTPEGVLATGAKPLGMDNYDVAFVTLYYPDEIIGQIHVSWVDSNKERLVCIIGSKARVEFNDLNNLEPIRIYEKGISIAERIEADFGDFRFLLRDGDIISPRTEMQEPLSQMIDSFVSVVLDDKEIISDGRFALEVTRVLVAIQKSLASRSIEHIVDKEG